MPSDREVVEDERRQVVDARRPSRSGPASASSSQGGRPAARILRGFVREVCRIVPPVRSIVRVLIRSSGRR